MPPQEDDQDTWCLIESDPAVFWDIANKLGVQGLDFQELYTLDSDELKYTNSREIRLKSVLDGLGQCLSNVPQNLFFAAQSQVIQNSCATQAMLSIVLNKRKQISIGPILDDFHQFTMNMTPDMRGFCLANQKDVREAHNSYGVTSALSIRSENSTGPKDDPFHFISLIPDEDSRCVYLLDGLMKGPLLLGQFDTIDNWHELALPAFQKIIQTLQTLPASGNEQPSTDIRFNLIAALPDNEKELQSQRHRLQKELAGALRALLLVEMDNDSVKLAKYKLAAVALEEFQRQPSADESKSKISALTLELEGLRQSLDLISRRHETWTKENVLRQHDLMPFYLSSLRNLAKRKVLSPAYWEAVRKTRQ